MVSETSPIRDAPPQPDTPSLEAAAPGGLSPEERAAKRNQMLLIGGGILFVVLLVVAIVLMASFPQATEVIRDIAIVFLAVVTFLIGIAVLLLLIQTQILIQVLRDEVQPLLRSMNDTASTVRGTTQFVSHNVVSPIIKWAGFAAGARRVVNDLTSVVKSARPRSVVPKEGNDVEA